ncbi:MAG: FG-GAP repeat protein, partial [Bacteroidota bacterium]
FHNKDGCSLCELLFLFFYAFCIVQFSASQNVGVGTITPTEKLHVAGNIKGDTVKPAAINFTPYAGAGKRLTSDAAGNASWQELSSSGGVGFGSWGDCSMNSISGYEPLADATGTVGDFFGFKVSISGNYAIAGAYADDVGANTNQGSKSIYRIAKCSSQAGKIQAN